MEMRMAAFMKNIKKTLKPLSISMGSYFITIWSYYIELLLYALQIQLKIYFMIFDSTDK